MSASTADGLVAAAHLRGASDQGTGTLITVSPAPGTVGAAIGAAWRQRALVGYFARRFNKKRYMRTWLGPVWLVLRPGLTIGWQLFVFATVAHLGANDGTPYPITLLFGFAVWHPFSEATYWVTRSLELNRRIIKSARIAGLVMSIAALAPAIIDAVVVVSFLVVALLIYLVLDGHVYLVLTPAALVIPIGLLLLLLMGLGIGLLLAVPGARARDVRFGLRIFLRSWYFLTPVVYSLNSVPHGLRPIVELNPAAGAIGLVTDGLLGIAPPSTLALISATVGSVGIFALGLFTFARVEDRTLDHL